MKIEREERMKGKPYFSLSLSQSLTLWLKEREIELLKLTVDNNL
jgi:hypothetical protein